MATYYPRDKNRTATTKARTMRQKNTKPPTDQGPWIALTHDFLVSPALCSLSINARRALDRLILEHLRHGGTENGRLVCPYSDFESARVSRNLIADALDELSAMGFVQVTRGRAGDGTPHANRYRLTFTGSSDGLPATNEWKSVTKEQVKAWRQSGRSKAKLRRTKMQNPARKTASPTARKTARASGVEVD